MKFLYRLLIFAVLLPAFLVTGCSFPRIGGPATETSAGSARESTDPACAYFYFLWGQSAEAEQRYEEALEAYEKVLVCDQDSTYVMQSLANLLMRMGRHGEAAEWLDKIIETHPGDIETQSLLAKLYISMGRADDATALYKNILARQENAETLLQLGILYARGQKYNKAKRTLHRLIDLEPDYFMGHYYLARLQRELHDVAGAVVSYEKALSISWSQTLALEMADFYESIQQYDKAVQLYREIIGDEGYSDPISLRLANVYLAMEEWDQAIEALREVRPVSANRQRIDLFISRILLNRERFDEAIALLTELLERNEGLHTARYLLAVAHYHNGDRQEAERLLGPIQPEDPEFEDGVMLLVRIYREAGDLDAAVRLLEAKLSDDASRRKNFYFVLAALYQEQEEMAKASEVFKEATAAYAENADVLYEYGLFLERTGDNAGAMARMREALEKDPDHASALNYIGYTWTEQGRNLQQALEYIERAVALRPQDGYIRDSLGWIHFKLGNLEQAISELETAVKLTGHDPVILEHLGDVYARAGRKAAAAARYERALALYRHDQEKEGVRSKLEALAAGR